MVVKTCVHVAIAPFLLLSIFLGRFSCWVEPILVLPPGVSIGYSSNRKKMESLCQTRNKPLATTTECSAIIAKGLSERGKCSLCLQVILYTIVVIKLFRKNEKLLKFSEKKEKEKIVFFG